MPKILPASCSAGVVTINDKIIASAIIGQGVSESEGLAFIDEGQVTYLTSNASDIKTLITNLVAIVNQIVTIATGLDGVTNSPGAQATAILQLTTLKTSLDATKDTLK